MPLGSQWDEPSRAYVDRRAFLIRTGLVLATARVLADRPTLQFTTTRARIEQEMDLILGGGGAQVALSLVGNRRIVSARTCLSAEDDPHYFEVSIDADQDTSGIDPSTHLSELYSAGLDSVLRRREVQIQHTISESLQSAVPAPRIFYMDRADLATGPHATHEPAPVQTVQAGARDEVMPWEEV